MDREKLAARLGEIKAECDIDGYGDEGEGYDFGKFLDLLLSDGWTPPDTVE